MLLVVVLLTEFESFGPSSFSSSSIFIFRFLFVITDAASPLSLDFSSSCSKSTWFDFGSCLLFLIDVEEGVDEEKDEELLAGGSTTTNGLTVRFRLFKLTVDACFC